MMKVYKAKKSRSMGILMLVIVGFVIFIGLILPLIIEREINEEFIMISLLTVLPVLVLICWTWWGTYHVLDGDTLKAKSGPIYWKIKISEIQKIKLNQPTITGMVRLTLSLKSMEVVYRKYSSIFILPKNENEFLEDIKTRNPYVKIQDQ